MHDEHERPIQICRVILVSNAPTRLLHSQAWEFIFFFLMPIEPIQQI
jgi:hypothetical protein